MATKNRATPDDARLLLRALRALTRTQMVSERADVRCCGMTVAQAAMIQVLHLEGPVGLGALGRRLGITPSTLTRNIERAEARRFVRRVPDRQDRRAFRLRLTPSGARKARELEEQNETFARLLLEELPSPGRALQGLMDLLGAIDRLSGPSCDDQFQPIKDFLQEQSRGKERTS